MTGEERQLVQRCLTGDHNAFGALYDRHAARVFHLLRRLTGNESEAEDLTQDTFLSAYRSLASWRGEGVFGTWLCGIAFRLYVQARRQSARKETELLDAELELAAPDADPLSYCARQESEQQIEAAIQALPPLCREVFVLVKVEGLSYREAAEWLDVPLGTVQSRLWRAVVLLKRALASLTDTEASSQAERPFRTLSRRYAAPSAAPAAKRFAGRRGGK